MALMALVFVPTAMAQTNYQGGGNQGMNSGGMGNMGMDQNMMSSPSASAMSGATASPTASATASPSASATATASQSASASTSATGSAAPSKMLPDTGGIPLAPLLSVGALVLLAGSGVFATRLTR